MKTPQTNLTVLRNDVEWNTRFEGSISSIEIDGQKLSDIHDLARKVDYNTKVTKKIAWVGVFIVAITLAIGAFLSQWIISNDGSIQDALDNDKRKESFEKLKSLGYKWNGIDWRREN